MAKLYIAEFERPRNQWVNIANAPPIVEQVVDYSGGVASSSAFNAKTAMIRVHTDAICSILIGTTPTAATTNARMAADTIEYYSVQPNQKISAISNT